MMAMRSAGLYSTEQIRPVNELKMRARHKLWRLLAAVVRGAGPGRGKKTDGARPSFSAYIKEIGLHKQSAQEAQRIGTLPDGDLEKVPAIKREADTPHACSVFAASVSPA